MLRTLCSLFAFLKVIGVWKPRFMDIIRCRFQDCDRSIKSIWREKERVRSIKTVVLLSGGTVPMCMSDSVRASSLRQLPEHPARVECLPAGHMSERLILTEGKYFIQHDPVTPSKWRKRKWQISQSHNNVEMSVEQLTALQNHFNSTCPISSLKPNWLILRVLLHGF